MSEQKTVIDANGNVIDSCVLVIDGTVQCFEMLEGYQTVDLLNMTQTINDRIVSFLKPKWDGSKWIETATSAELNIKYPALAEVPSVEDRVAALEGALLNLM